MLSFLDQIKIRFRHWIMPQNVIIKLADPHKNILDIGCGLGIFLKELSGQGKNLKGVEISLPTVKKAKEMLAQNKVQDIEIDHFNGDPQSIPFWNTYDVVFLNDVLHHIPPQNQEAFLQKIYGNMRKGSQLILKDIDASSPLVYFNKIHDIVLNKQYPHERSMADCHQMCTNMGFVINEQISIRKLVYPHFILVMTKI